jgi:hypothetical protein
MANKDGVKHEGWVASLSNGETVFETPESENVLGERKPWGKLIDRCEEEGLWVTQIQVQTGGKTIVGIRNAEGYCTFVDWRKEGLMAEGRGGPTKETEQRGVGSVVGNTVYCTVINDQGQTWQDSRPLASMRLHCILKPAGGQQAELEEFIRARLKNET